MRASYRCEVQAECDNEECREELILDNIDVEGRPTRVKLFKLAKKMGWVFDGDKSWCPKCALIFHKRKEKRHGRKTG